MLHLGLPKTGTTYLQGVLLENRGRLARRAGVLVPGEERMDQVRAASDVLAGSGDGGPVPESAGAWKRLIREVKAWPASAVISMEWLCTARPAQAARILRTLEPLPVDVVFTVRDLARTVPAAWQESMKNGEVTPWPEFLRSVMADEPTGPGIRFWRRQGISRMLTVWGDLLPAERIHVVTVPAAGHPATLLWSRFAEVLGVEADAYAASGAASSNTSIGWQSAEFMRRLNAVSKDERVSWAAYQESIKEVVASALARRRHREDAIVLPSSAAAWALERATVEIEAIRSSGVHVIGDLDDLTPIPAAGGELPPEPLDEELLTAALESLVALALDWRRMARRAEAAGRSGKRGAPRGHGVLVTAEARSNGQA